MIIGGDDPGRRIRPPRGYLWHGAIRDCPVGLCTGEENGSHVWLAGDEFLKLDERWRAVFQQGPGLNSEDQTEVLYVTWSFSPIARTLA